MVARVTATAIALCGAALLACSQPVDHVASPPTSAQYQVTFPSTAVAVASDTVQVLVFDASATGADCLSLVTARRTGAQLPKGAALLLDTGAVQTCDLAAGQGTFQVSYGSRSFFAIAQRAGQDFFTGCTQADVEANIAPVNISLAQDKTGTTVPPTTCTSLSEKCNGGSC
jgi:hypothetical protein